LFKIQIFKILTALVKIQKFKKNNVQIILKILNFKAHFPKKHFEKINLDLISFLAGSARASSSSFGGRGRGEGRGGRGGCKVQGQWQGTRSRSWSALRKPQLTLIAA
jgi:hypothetical protein